MIVVVLPSKNEADNIGNITRIVDAGLAKYFPDVQSMILNVDSCSLDGTEKLFLSQDTVIAKKQIILPPEYIGKGYNLKAGMNYALSIGAKCILTLDTDVRSAKPEWIQKFVDGILTDHNDLMVPIYTRNRYEGNTTNHFSSPIIYSCWGKDIQQPIAGDFGISAKLAEKFVGSFNITADYQYGVDTLLTWTALAHDFSVSQVHLGQKIHNPSFEKIVEMFQQVSSTTIQQILLHKDKIMSRLSFATTQSFAKGEDAECDAIDDSFVRRPDENSILKLEKIAGGFLGQTGKSTAAPAILNLDCWIAFLSKMIVGALRQNWSQEQIETELRRAAGYYFLRVAHYIKEIDSRSSSEISEILVDTKSSLRDRVLLDFSSSFDAISCFGRGGIHG